MAINKAMQAALKALSYSQPDIKKSYPRYRQLETITGKRVSPFYKPWDHQVHLDGRDIPVRLFAPKIQTMHTLLLFFHGGGWVCGNIDSYDKTCSRMAHLTGCMVVSVDYRLAPEHKFPQGLEDCYAVAREIYLDADLFNIPPQDIVLIGDSAGGNLAAAVSLMARDRGEFAVARQILIYPATYHDHSPASPFPSVRENADGYLLTSQRVCDYMDLYAAKESDFKNPYFAPLLSPDLSHQPDTLVITAEYDPLRDEGEAYAQALRAAGNRVELHRIRDALHGFLALPPRFSHVKQAYRIIHSFLQKEGLDGTPHTSG